MWQQLPPKIQFLSNFLQSSSILSPFLLNFLSLLSSLSSSLPFSISIFPSILSSSPIPPYFYPSFIPTILSNTNLYKFLNLVCTTSIRYNIKLVWQFINNQIIPNASLGVCKHRQHPLVLI